MANDACYGRDYEFMAKGLSFTFRFKQTGYMLIRLQRLEVTDYGVFGHLTCGEFDCVTLERDDTLIPCGTYKVTRYHSLTLNREVLLLHDVPNRTFIEIHNANWENQLKGCIAVGKRRNGKAIENSVVTLEALLKALQGAVEMEITIT